MNDENNKVKQSPTDINIGFFIKSVILFSNLIVFCKKVKIISLKRIVWLKIMCNRSKVCVSVFEVVE